ncbi:hypothetical protein HYW55_05885 [Candidatus Gottesmanbacteria bacterium]|nr:hypothetical protein [Candidatus Gottesmanbacteria bacterium]
MKKLFATLTGFTSVLLASSPAFAQDTTITISRPANLNITEFGKLIGAIIGAALVLATLAAFFFLLWGGIQWITSGGDKAGVESAQHRIQAALLGLLIVFSIPFYGKLARHEYPLYS